MLQHPVYGIIVAIFITTLCVTQSIQYQQLLKKRLGASFLNILLWIGAIFVYPYIVGHQTYEIIYIAATFINYAVFIVMLFNLLKQSIFKTHHYQLFIKSIKHSHWNAYYIVDHKERIKDISTSLLTELNLDKDEVMGKKLFQVLNQAVRILKRNEVELNNHMLEAYYQTYKKNAKANTTEQEELKIQNYKGDVVILHFVTQPIFSFGKYKGRICVGEKKTDFELLSVEKHLNQTNDELESLRHKFIATLELSEEGIFYIDLDEKLVWFNDVIVEKLGFNEHEMDLDGYRKLIEPEDLKKYLSVISDLTSVKNSYLTTYRVKVGHAWVWIREKGKRLFEDAKNAVIMGTLMPMQGTHFRKSGIDILDDLQDENHLIADMNQLIAKHKPFQLAIIVLKNIPVINEHHGRVVGNMIMGNYVHKIKQSFVTESSNIYRISGLEFAFTITDPRKMAGLKTGIESGEKFFNLTMNYGSIQIELEAFIGIATMGDDANNAQDLCLHASQALKTAQHPHFKGQGLYYKDINHD